MSRKKEKKIKRLRKFSLWPQIIEAFLVEATIIAVMLFVLAIDFYSDRMNLVSSAPKTCARIISDVENNWNTAKKKLGDQGINDINKILDYNHEAIGGVSIIDDEKNILASYGDEIENPEKFFKYYSKESLDRNLVYFSDRNIEREYEEEIKYYFTEEERKQMELEDDDFVDDDDDDDVKGAKQEVSDSEHLGFYNYFATEGEDSSIANYTKLFFGSGEDAELSSRRLFRWTTTTVGSNTLWVMYKTTVPGVNVAIKKRVGLTYSDTGRHGFILGVLGLCFAFIFIYENYKIITAIINRRKVHKIVFTDPVTGGHNKEYFVRKAKRLIRSRRDRKVMVYVRMEKYRNYITAYGLKEGENLMEDFYMLLNSIIRKRKELAVHLEKSDFALLLHYDNDELLNIRMQTITKALNETRPNQHLFFTVGACLIQSWHDSIQEKITNAGSAISKQENKNDKVLWYDDSIREEQLWERRVEDDMDKALENHEFKVYLQPKYSTKKEVLSAAEALVRWIHPEYGFVSPGKFIPIFEKNGFIIKLDDFMLDEVSRLQAGWLSEGKKLVPVSVNVSRAHFSRDDLAEHIRGIVDAHKVPHEFIELELTESAFFDDKQVILNTVRKLKEYGFKVSMDDFGAGYSSLNSLKELPLDIIKLDAQFFREIDDKSRADIIVGDTIKLAKKLGMQIVAEGIETREQVDFLADQHCDLIQGFYFAKPLPVEEFEERAFKKKGKKKN